MALGDDKEEKRAREAEEKRLARERRKSGGISGASIGAGTVTGSGGVGEINRPSTANNPSKLEETTAAEAPFTTEPREATQAPVHIRTSTEDQASLRMQQNADAANEDLSTPMSPGSPPKDDSKVKNWLKTHFRRLSKSSKPIINEKEATSENNRESSFIGGAALTGASANNSTVSLGQRSAREVAMAKTETGDTTATRGRKELRPEEPMSPVTDQRDDEEFQEARDNFNEDLVPPTKFSAEKEPSPARQGKFTEEI
jgi:hypothetical protein